MQISLQQASKRFNKEWIFRNLDYTFELGQHYALIGNNGSGKSTLLQIIAGYSSLTKGSIHWSDNDHTTIFQQISFAAPYLELVEEFTTMEQFEFHATFKTLQSSITVNDIIERIGLKNSAHKQIRYFSSGMKQRLKLALAIFSETPILLLDEPCSNLDKEGYALYHDLIRNYAMHKLIIIGSNDTQEYDYCTKLFFFQSVQIFVFEIDLPEFSIIIALCLEMQRSGLLRYGSGLSVAPCPCRQCGVRCGDRDRAPLKSRHVGPAHPSQSDQSRGRGPAQRREGVHDPAPRGGQYRHSVPPH